MHYTTGSGRVSEIILGTSRYLHADQNLPTTVGTTGSAEYFNAVGMEIIGVIEAAGLTISSSPSVDRTAGWTQLKTAIFESAAIDTDALATGAVTDAKVNDLSLSTLTTGVMSIVVSGGAGIEHETTLTTASVSSTSFALQYSDTSGSPDTVSLLSMSHESIIQEYMEDLVTTKRAELSYDGLEFLNSDHAVRFAVVDFSSATWEPFAGIAPNPSGLLARVTTSLPTSTRPMTASFSYTYDSKRYVDDLVSTTFQAQSVYFDDDGGYWRATVQMDANLGASSYSLQRLMVWYSDD